MQWKGDFLIKGLFFHVFMGKNLIFNFLLHCSVHTKKLQILFKKFGKYFLWVRNWVFLGLAVLFIIVYKGCLSATPSFSLLADHHIQNLNMWVSKFCHFCWSVTNDQPWWKPLPATNKSMACHIFYIYIFGIYFTPL